MKKKAKQKLRIREYTKRKNLSSGSIEQNKQEIIKKLKELTQQKTKLTKGLQELSSSRANLTQISQAGMLAHYAVLAILLSSIVKNSQQRYFEKELEKIGKKSMDYDTKLSELTAFQKANSLTEVALEKYEQSGDEDKKIRYDEFKALSDKRDDIAKRLGLNPQEFKSLSNAMNEIDIDAEIVYNNTKKDMLRQV